MSDINDLKRRVEAWFDTDGYKSWWGLWDELGTEPIEDEGVAQQRWSVTYRTVFEYEGKFYEFYRSEPATENQELDEYEMLSEFTSLYEVTPQEVTVTKYVRA